jgi:hypothetical protein
VAAGTGVGAGVGAGVGTPDGAEDPPPPQPNAANVNSIRTTRFDEQAIGIPRLTLKK